MSEVVELLGGWETLWRFLFWSSEIAQAGLVRENWDSYRRAV